MSRNVILLFGGESQERFVSVATAQNLSRVLPDARCWFWAPNEQVFEISGDVLRAHKDPFNTALEIKTPPLFETLESALDCPDYTNHVFFLGLHGGRGEDGTVQKWLESRKLAFTGSTSEACFRAFDKVLAKRIVADFGVKIAPTLVVQGTSKETENSLSNLLLTHRKIVVKPVSDGSSVGLCIVDSDRGLQRALEILGSQSERAFIAEPFISGPELTVGVVDEKDGPRALPCTEIRAQSGRVFDYNGKYLGEGVQEITPAEVADAFCLKAQEMARTAHKALGCTGYSRTDLIINDGEPVYLETNTLPGLTRASLVPQQLAADGTTMATFVEKILTLAESRRDAKSF